MSWSALEKSFALHRSVILAAVIWKLDANPFSCSETSSSKPTNDARPFVAELDRLSYLVVAHAWRETL